MFSGFLVYGNFNHHKLKSSWSDLGVQSHESTSTHGVSLWVNGGFLGGARVFLGVRHGAFVCVRGWYFLKGEC